MLYMIVFDLFDVDKMWVGILVVGVFVIEDVGVIWE